MYLHIKCRMRLVYAFGRWQMACTSNKKITGGVVFLSHVRCIILLQDYVYKKYTQTHAFKSPLTTTMRVASYTITYRKIRVYGLGWKQ